MLRVHSTDELAADALWTYGATAVVERNDCLEASYGSPEATAAAFDSIRDRWRAELVQDDAAAARGWRAHAEPITAGSLTIRPAWIDGPGLSIEPGDAFGIGNHPSTRLAVAALEGVVTAGSSVLDVGTGTGVLALAAVTFGATHVVALDIDAEAVAVARANARANSFEHAVEVRHSGVHAVTEMFDVVVANLGGLLAPTALARDLAARCRRTVIVSGLLDPASGGPSIYALDDALRAGGLRSIGVTALDGWVAAVWGRAG